MHRNYNAAPGPGWCLLAGAGLSKARGPEGGLHELLGSVSRGWPCSQSLSRWWHLPLTQQTCCMHKAHALPLTYGPSQRNVRNPPLPASFQIHGSRQIGWPVAKRGCTLVELVLQKGTRSTGTWVSLHPPRAQCYRPDRRSAAKGVPANSHKTISLCSQYSLAPMIRTDQGQGRLLHRAAINSQLISTLLLYSN